MFKIYDDKVYFVAETPDINKVIEIFLPKDDRGTIMDSHEIRVDLCRAIRKLQHDGYTIMKVYPAMGDRRESIDVMRNGDDYYIIDMALAENSALNDCVPSNRLRAYPQQWLPGESNS